MRDQTKELKSTQNANAIMRELLLTGPNSTLLIREARQVFETIQYVLMWSQCLLWTSFTAIIGHTTLPFTSVAFDSPSKPLIFAPNQVIKVSFLENICQLILLYIRASRTYVTFLFCFVLRVVIGLDRSIATHGRRSKSMYIYQFKWR